MKKIIPNDAVVVPDQAEQVFEGKIYDVYQWPQALFDGSTTTFEMLKRPDTVSAVCIVNDRILVLEDEQPHSGSHRSLPGGRVDETDTGTLQAIQREVLEETGYSFRSWRLIRVEQPHSKIEWFIYLYLATEPEDQVQQPHLDGGEKIVVEQLSFSQLHDLILEKAGYLVDLREVFESAADLPGLRDFPEFSGQTVDR